MLISVILCLVLRGNSRVIRQLLKPLGGLQVHGKSDFSYGKDYSASWHWLPLCPFQKNVEEAPCSVSRLSLAR